MFESRFHLSFGKQKFHRRLFAASLMNVALVVWSIAFLILVGGSPVAAQNPQPSPDLTDTSLEELRKIEVKSVYSASKYTQKVTEAPASVSIVTADEIKKYGHRTLADILRG